MKKNFKANRLVALVNSEKMKRGWTLHDFAEELKVSYIHMSSLMGGSRQFSGLKQDKQRKLASLLGISMVDFLLYCGVLQPRDLNAL
jgi:transcriptional regulator with XRE-family HTH domain